MRPSSFIFFSLSILVDSRKFWALGFSRIRLFLSIFSVSGAFYVLFWIIEKRLSKCLPESSGLIFSECDLLWEEVLYITGVLGINLVLACGVFILLADRFILDFMIHGLLVLVFKRVLEENLRSLNFLGVFFEFLNLSNTDKDDLLNLLVLKSS